MEKLVEGAQAGSSQNQAQILDRLRPLIYASMRKYPNYRESSQDSYQDGVLEILEAIEDYDPSRGAYFLGYVKMRLRFMYLNKYEAVTIHSLNESLAGDPEGAEKIDFLVDPEDKYQDLERMDQYRELYQAYQVLSPRERQVVDYYYIGRLSMVEIAKTLGISYRTVVNTKTRALARLRKYYKI